jgi:Putative heme iron utilization protein
MIPDAPLPDNNRLALRQVARACRKASLATVLASDATAPYASLATVALDHDLAPILLLSELADHTRNLLADPRISLLLDGTDGHPNPQTGPRVTLTGRAERRDGDERLKARFLARHPGAALYAGFADFSIWRMAPERAHFVGGFGRAMWFDAPFGMDPALVAETAALEGNLVAEANDSHRDALARLGDGWLVAAVDVDGIDLTNGETFMRRNYCAAVESPGGFRAAIASLFANVSHT